ncbi:polar amino acid transport system substrate-binding protein [Rhizobium paknamense]|uniref:Polar amino acid transport system substrate-binding protein n=1 Tax=Rhizobium paknamense TaxID=1206817 RepID=A0ABU0IAI8_9HYPH|nr:transporter substrate-binding domain-containing protein [Rhizobium paknamense]MDQ0455231.1 polar amino acid transport system substrate-binding protein [Rhizobium paknamense]
MFLLLLTAPPSRAAEGQAAFPVLFDAKERLPKPDLSDLLRLRFLTTNDFPPFSFMDQTGHLTGFNIELIRAICVELGVAAKCEIQAVPFGDIEISLLSKHGDAALAGNAVTRTLRQDFAFSRPYLLLPARFAVGKTLASATSPETLKGKAVGVLAGSAHEQMLKAFFPDLTPQAFPDRPALLEALKTGKVSAVFGDGLQLSFWLASPASGACCGFLGGPYLSQHFLGEGMSLMVRKEDGFLAAAFDHALASLSRDGTLDALARQYFPLGLY